MIGLAIPPTLPDDDPDVRDDLEAPLHRGVAQADSSNSTAPDPPTRSVTVDERDFTSVLDCKRFDEETEREKQRRGHFCHEQDTFTLTAAPAGGEFGSSRVKFDRHARTSQVPSKRIGSRTLHEAWSITLLGN